MTDGTSQGLFIVVAIVIFGIFVVMAYILFEDTISPALASMFTNATEVATSKLEGIKTPFNMDDMKSYSFQHMPGLDILSRDRNAITFRTDAGTIHAGIHIPATYFEIGEKYKISYDITLLEGEIYRLGGHLSGTSYQNIKVNGEDIEGGNYHKGFDYDLEKGKTYTVDVEFYKHDVEWHSGMWFHIQPNRTNVEGEELIYTTDYTVKIENVFLLKLR